ncbi:hypothetical protein BpHYR1_016994 [Brachionus plicatilis]|uniref:Uncharacterized protein n=1 Tax=Brachionus plicatilis TaxID=10195 RepID=A0A3M7T7C2_BRAPC|nr:hypothetical protein BpHYR1_016994 [Brachionus plicatilis]
MHTIKKYLIKKCNKLQSFCRAWNSVVPNLYNIVLFIEPFLHNTKINYSIFTFCTLILQAFSYLELNTLI